MPGALVFRPTSGPVDLRDWRQWWHWAPGASWRHPFGPDSELEFEDRRGPPRRAGRLPRRGGLRPVGGAATADRGRMGVRGPRRCHHHVPVGRRRRSRRSADGQHLAGPIPVPQRRRARLGGHVAGRHLPAERVRPGRHDRQRVGVDDDAVLGAPPARRARRVVLWADWTAGPVGESDAQGRLASVRAGVLPPLPPGGPLTAVAGQRDNAHRVPLRGSVMLPPKRTTSRRYAPGASARTVGAIRSHRGRHSSARSRSTARTTASATVSAGIGRGRVRP